MKRQSASTRSRAFELVVIGASAGGIEVLNVLLGALPGDFAPAVMIVMHLPPDSPSYLVQRFAHRCALPVLEPDAGERISPAACMLRRPAITCWWKTTAPWRCLPTPPCAFRGRRSTCCSSPRRGVYGERLLAILLSGANDDGAHGLETVRAAGGAAWVQAPETAAVAGNAARRDRARRSGRNSVSLNHGPAACRIAGLYRQS